MTLIQTLVGAVVAVGLIVAAVAMLAGPGWAMLCAGVCLLAGVVLLHDPDAVGSGKPRR